MNMEEVKYLTKEEIIKIHEKILAETGGASGILNEGLLDLVLDQMKVSDDLVQNHPFVDGNKRTALESLYILKIARNEISKNAVRKWIITLTGD